MPNIVYILTLYARDFSITSALHCQQSMLGAAFFGINHNSNHSF